MSSRHTCECNRVGNVTDLRGRERTRKVTVPPAVRCKYTLDRWCEREVCAHGLAEHGGGAELLVMEGFGHHGRRAAEGGELRALRLEHTNDNPTMVAGPCECEATTRAHGLLLGTDLPRENRKPELSTGNASARTDSTTRTEDISLGRRAVGALTQEQRASHARSAWSINGLLARTVCC